MAKTFVESRWWLEGAEILIDVLHDSYNSHTDILPLNFYPAIRMQSIAQVQGCDR